MVDTRGPGSHFPDQHNRININLINDIFRSDASYWNPRIVITLASTHHSDSGSGSGRGKPSVLLIDITDFIFLIPHTIEFINI